MKTTLTLALLAAATLCTSCGDGTKTNGAAQTDSIAPVTDTTTPQTNTPAPVADTTAAEPTQTAQASTPTNASPYDAVTKWVVDVTSVTTISFDITPEEAANIERGNYGKYAKLFKEFSDDIFVNDIDGEYFIIYHDEVVNDTRTITDPRLVKKLNTMMQNARYSDYASSVHINGTTARARWYGGNRGGGIAEDFPKDVASALDF